VNRFTGLSGFRIVPGWLLATLFRLAWPASAGTERLAGVAGSVL
jgi:hypothetical protein